MVTRKRSIGGFDLIEAGAGLNPQHPIGIFRAHPQMRRLQAPIGGFRNSERRRRAIQKLKLARMGDAVRNRYVKKAIEHVFKNGGRIVKDLRHLAQILVKSRHILLGELIDHPDLLRLVFRK